MLIDVTDYCLVGSQSILSEYRLRAIEIIIIRSVLPLDDFDVRAGGGNLADCSRHRGWVHRRIGLEVCRIGGVARHGDGAWILRVIVVPAYEVVTSVGIGSQGDSTEVVHCRSTRHRAHGVV